MKSYKYFVSYFFRQGEERGFSSDIANSTRRFNKKTIEEDLKYLAREIEIKYPLLSNVVILNFQEIK